MKTILIILLFAYSISAGSASMASGVFSLGTTRSNDPEPSTKRASSHGLRWRLISGEIIIQLTESTAGTFTHISDARGRIIRTLPVDVGGIATWDRRNSRGNQVSAGAYLLVVNREARGVILCGSGGVP